MSKKIWRQLRSRRHRTLYAEWSMLRRYIERRERQLYARDTDRTSLAFQWGADLVGLPANGNPLASLQKFAVEALRSSDTFYSKPPLSDASLQDGLLRFPSPVQTEFSENNVVWGRWFDADGDFAVIVLPQWNCDWDGHVKLCRLLQRSGIATVRLSMPYHHFRKPPNLKRPEYMVSANIGQTIHAARQAVLDTRCAVDWLMERGYRKIGILGSSLGSCIAFLTFAHDERISAGVFIHVSGYFGDVVWHGLSTRHVRQSLDGFITEQQLRELWAPISPFPYIKRLQ